MARWRECGYSTARSSGSHGIWDVCAVKNNRPVELIQCKVVQNEAAAKRLIKAFTMVPPFEPSECYHQVLEVKIKGSTDIMSVTV